MWEWWEEDWDTPSPRLGLTARSHYREADPIIDRNGDAWAAYEEQPYLRYVVVHLRVPWLVGKIIWGVWRRIRRP